MKHAKAVRAMVVEVECPECGGSIESATGSLLWVPEDWIAIGQVLRCQECGQHVKTPRNPFDHAALRKARADV